MIAAALSRGELPEDLHLHVEGCPTCREVFLVAQKLRKMAVGRFEELRPSAASMWWRLSFRMRREKAWQAQASLIWMGRTFFLTTAFLLAKLLAMSHPALSSPVCRIGLLSLGVAVLPVTIALWSWSRS